MVSRLALAAIDGYQRYVSPRKGYACAYRVAHGGTGCSGYAKTAIADLGLLRAIPAIRQRFADCRDAAEELQTAKRKREKDKWYNCDCGGCDIPTSRGCGKADTTPDCACTPDGCSF